jgi:hypothetical protein
MIVSLKTDYAGAKMLNKNDSNPEAGGIHADVGNYNKASDFGLYKTDAQTREGSVAFDQTVGTINPVWAMFEETDGYPQNGNYQDHVYQYINKFKVCEISVGSAADLFPPHPSSDVWGNWRKKNPAGIAIQDHVFLFPTETNFGFSYTHEWGEGWEAADPGGLFSKISQLAESIRSAAVIMGSTNIPVAGKLVSRYRKSPSWKATEPIKGPNSLKFSFQFGQSGIFSGEHEVVRPILALASLFTPLRTGGHYYRGPMPTPPFILMNVLAAAAKTMKDAGGKNAMNANTDNEGLIGKITSLEEKIIGVQEEGIINAYSGGMTRVLNIRMGRLVIGPYIVKDVNWDFDFEQTDEYGYPYKGTVNFGGLESIVMPDPGLVTHMFDYAGGGAADGSFTNAVGGYDAPPNVVGPITAEDNASGREGGDAFTASNNAGSAAAGGAAGGW